MVSPLLVLWWNIWYDVILISKVTCWLMLRLLTREKEILFINFSPVFRYPNSQGCQEATGSNDFQDSCVRACLLPWILVQDGWKKWEYTHHDENNDSWMIDSFRLSRFSVCVRQQEDNKTWKKGAALSALCETNWYSPKQSDGFRKRAKKITDVWDTKWLMAKSRMGLRAWFPNYGMSRLFLYTIPSTSRYYPLSWKTGADNSYYHNS